MMQQELKDLIMSVFDIKRIFHSVEIKLMDTEKFKTTEEMANSIFANDQRGRTLKQVRDSTEFGVHGEVLIYHCLKSAGVKVDWNIVDKRNSDSYAFDILIEDEFRLEVKTQRIENCKKFFSFEDKEVTHNFRKNWEKYDLMIVVARSEDHFIPWLLIDSVCFDPKRELFVPSNYKGWYLKNDVCKQKGLLEYL